MRAHHIMTRQVITIGPESPIVEAAKTMLQHHISGLPVVDAAGKLIGIVSESDFIRRAEIGTQRERGRWLRFLVGPGRIASDFVHERGRKLRQIMTPDPVAIAEDTPLREIVRTMDQHHVKRLPVVRRDRLVGIVTRCNLLQAVADLARTFLSRLPTTTISGTASARRSRTPTGRLPGLTSLCVTVSCI